MEKKKEPNHVKTGVALAIYLWIKYELYTLYTRQKKKQTNFNSMEHRSDLWTVQRNKSTWG